MIALNSIVACWSLFFKSYLAHAKATHKLPDAG